MRIGEVRFADYFSAQGDADEIRTFRHGEGQTGRARASRSPLFLFAITAAEACIGERVGIEGSYRRGLHPYVEMSRLTTDAKIMHRTYSRWVQLALTAAATTAEWIWLNAVRQTVGRDRDCAFRGPLR
jgi:hypothetical protein